MHVALQVTYAMLWKAMAAIKKDVSMPVYANLLETKVHAGTGSSRDCEILMYTSNCSTPPGTMTHLSNELHKGHL